MADERDLKRWQFSLGRLLGAVTLLCVSLSAMIALYRENMPGLFGVVGLMSLGSIVGTIIGGIKGATLGVLVVFLVVFIALSLVALAVFIFSFIF